MLLLQILSLIPQLVIAPYCYDKQGAVICAEQYDFSPTEVLAKVSIEEYIVFAIYILEYKTLILEQLAEEQERLKLKAITEASIPKSSISNDLAQIMELPPDLSTDIDHDVIPSSSATDAQSELLNSAPYGVLLYTCVIRYVDM
jgi:hypothetical protein